jgi:hypothetical protein
MRIQTWKATVVAALGCLISGSEAQTGSLTDLGTLLGSQKNLTTFYSLIQVCYGEVFWWRVCNTLDDTLHLSEKRATWGMPGPEAEVQWQILD